MITFFLASILPVSSLTLSFCILFFGPWWQENSGTKKHNEVEWSFASPGPYDLAVLALLVECVFSWFSSSNLSDKSSVIFSSSISLYFCSLFRHFRLLFFSTIPAIFSALFPFSTCLHRASPPFHLHPDPPAQNHLEGAPSPAAPLRMKSPTPSSESGQSGISSPIMGHIETGTSVFETK